MGNEIIYQKEKKFNKVNILIVLVIVMFAICVLLSKLLYDNLRKDDIVIIPQEYFHVKAEGNEDIADLAKKWVNEYIAQYMQEGLLPRKKIANIDITDVKVLDEENSIVQVDFKLTKQVKSSTYFDDLRIGLYSEDGVITCNWVMTLQKITTASKEELCIVTKRINSAQYDIEQYITSGQAEEDEKYYSYMNEQKFKDLECTYKVENAKLYVTYDNSKTWQELNYDLSPYLNEKSYKLEEGLYYISKDVTAFAFNSYNNGPLIIYSSDMLKSVKIIDNTTEFKGKGIKNISFLNKDTGYVITNSDYAMGRLLGVEIYKTIDGANSFKKISSPLEGSIRDSSSYYFLNEQISFICETSADGATSTLYRSEDGGINYNKVYIEPQVLKGNLDNDTSSWNDIYDTPEIPKLVNNELILVVGQGSDGDYQGGDTKAAYKSNDLGKTWQFIEEYRQATDPSDG